MARRFLAVITVLEGGGLGEGLHPEHPIVLPPEPPLSIWGPPTVGLHPEHPIVLPPDVPGVPAHPIVLPPNTIWPPPGTPSHPIVIPPDQPPEIWPPAGVITNPMVPPTEAVLVVGVVPGYGLTWIKVKPVESLPVATPYKKS